MPQAQLDANTAESRRLIAMARAYLPGLLTLTSEERKLSNGKWRDGEIEPSYGLIDATIQFPQYFDGLADKDEGLDPTRFEPELLRDRLQRCDLLRTVATPLEDFSAEASDSVLHLGELTKPVLNEAYGIAKTQAKHNSALKSLIAKLLDFYSSIGRKAAATRAGNQATAKAAAEAAAKK